MAQQGRQQVDVPFALGLDQKSDVRYLSAGAGAQIINGVRLKNSAVRKRCGHVALSKSAQSKGTSANLSTSLSGGSFNGTPLLYDGHGLWSWSDTMANWRGPWFPRGVGNVPGVSPVPELSALPRRGEYSDIFNAVDWDIAIYNEYVVMATTIQNAGSTTSITVTVVDATSGTTVWGPSVVFGNAYFAPKVCILNGCAFVTASNGSGVLYGWAIVLNVVGLAGATTIPATTAFAGGQSPSYAYDCAAVPGTNGMANYVIQTSSTTLTVGYISCPASGAWGYGTAGTVTIASGTLVDVAIMCKGITFTHWIAYETSTSVFALGVADDGVTGQITNTVNSTVATLGTSGSGKIDVAQNAYDATSAVVMSSTNVAMGSWPSSPASITVQPIHTSAGATAVLYTATVQNVQLGSRAIVTSDGVGLFMAYLPSTYQPTNFVIGISNWSYAAGVAFIPRIVSEIDTRLAGSAWGKPFNGTQNWTKSKLISVGAGVMPDMKGSGVAALVPVATSRFHSALALQPFDYMSPLNGRILDTANSAGETLVACGSPQGWDGSGLVEVGAAWYPEITVAVSTGGSVDVGAHQYVVTYERVDANGNIVRSAPSVPVTATTTSGTQTVTVTIPYLLSNGNYGVAQSWYAVVYRTLLNGTTFYRVSPDPSQTAATAPTLSTTTTTYVDTATDASISAAATAQILYDTGGVIDNMCPPSATIAIQHLGRWLLSGTNDPKQIWPSTPFQAGTLPGFNEALNIVASGQVTALASMDTNLIIFVLRGSQYGIEYVSGYGPNNLGTNSDWSPPTPIVSDTGAVDHRGVCTIPTGTLFRGTVGGPNGSGGIFLLSRGLQVTYISGPVEDVLAANPVVTSMIVHPTNGRVYITCTPTETGFTSGIRLVYDYVHDGTWTVDQIYDADTTQTSAGARCAWVAYSAANGGMAYYWATLGGRVYRETIGVGSNSYLDGAQWVTLSYTSAWLKPSQAGSCTFHTVQLEADSLDAHNLVVSIGFDYAPSTFYQEIVPTWTAAQIAIFDRYPQEDVQVTPHNQKAKAIQISITDAAPTGGPTATTGQGPSLASLSLDFEVGDGLYPNLPPRQRA